MSAKEELNKVLQENTVDGTKYEGAIFAIQQLIHNNTKAIEELGKNIKSLEQSIKDIDSTVGRVPKNIDTSYSKALNSICTTMEVNVRSLDDNVKNVITKLEQSCLDVDESNKKIKNLQDDMQNLSTKVKDTVNALNFDRKLYLLFVFLFVVWLAAIRYTEWKNIYAWAIGIISCLCLAFEVYGNNK